MGVVVPTLLIFSLESASSVKYWQAIQRIPQPKPNTDANDADTLTLTQKRRLRRLLIFAAVILVLFTTAFMAPIFLKDVTKLKILYLCTLSIPITAIIVLMMMTLSGRIVHVVARGNNGKPCLTTKMKRNSLCLKRIFTIFGAVIAVCALWFNHPLAVFVVFAALIHGGTRNHITTGKLRLRYIFYMAAAMCLLWAVLTIMLVQVEKDSPNATTPNESVPLLEEKTSIAGLVNWTNVFMSTFWSSLLFRIASTCYRFDYTNSLPPEFRPEVSKKTNIGFIIRYPTRLADCDAFPRPYFNAALVSLFSSYAVIAVLSAYTTVKITYDAVAAFSLCVSPLMMVSVLVLAAVKGQFRKLWNYEEDWGAVPSVSAEAEKTEVTLVSESLEEDDLEKVESEKYLLSLDEVGGEQAV
ncbi:hypothetical protein EW145_g2841 [Phellinidium pouzarii]|uniref:Uncharacterized protein n=1 Tax=Phellinidium pouzarii TaxID=167371 RepID=A0A4S4L9K1_9AGAM|nr:hypothetical protein EW145_g2841 [Phellinidium pouzarii]